MTINVAINGYGRIGRCVLRALYERDQYHREVRVCAINELADLESVYHLTKYDSTHGRFPGHVGKRDNGIAVDGDEILVLHEKKVENLPWRELGIDVVLECSGSFKDRKTAEKHIQQGATKLIFSQPAENKVDATIVYGVNHDQLRANSSIISNASCTTNCITPVLMVLNEAFGIQRGTITTIHSAMHDQPVIDAYDRDLRKTRSAMQSIIPVSTGLNVGIGRIMPSMENIIETLAIRVPTTNVSLMDLTVEVKTPTSAEEVNSVLFTAAKEEFNGVLGYTEEELVSCDFNHDPRSSIVDGSQTRVSGSRLLKVLSWFDNEWGFANRMLDTTIATMNAAKNSE